MNHVLKVKRLINPIKRFIVKCFYIASQNTNNAA